jgi:hypothetical protein
MNAQAFYYTRLGAGHNSLSILTYTCDSLTHFSPRANLYFPRLLSQFTQSAHPNYLRQ